MELEEEEGRWRETFRETKNLTKHDMATPRWGRQPLSGNAKTGAGGFQFEQCSYKSGFIHAVIYEREVAAKAKKKEKKRERKRKRSNRKRTDEKQRKANFNIQIGLQGSRTYVIAPMKGLIIQDFF